MQDSTTKFLHASSKHMDKHERPFKCTIDGCDNPQGSPAKVTFCGAIAPFTNRRVDRVIYSSAMNQAAHADPVVLPVLPSAAKITSQIICVAGTGDLLPLLLAFKG